MSNYLDYFPEPFLDDIVKNKCIPFIGAGFSRNAAFPDGYQMPLWDDLGKKLSASILGYEYTGPIDAISAYEHEYSRAKLIEELTKHLLIDIATPSNTHKSFCKLPFNLVATTNIDFLLERGYEAVKRYCCPIVQEDRLAVSIDGVHINLLKLHGDLHHPNHLIVTEDDYDVFIEKYPLYATFIANLLISKTALFIGYSLDDPDFRHIWRLVSERLGKVRRHAYAILVNAKAHIIARYERRGVKVINLPGKESEYAKILEDVFSELGRYWDKRLIESSTAKEENTLNELSLPSDSENRLCLFFVSFEMYSFYRSYVFPIVEKHGLIPITAEDILSPGDNFLAKVSALISRSKIIIVDVSSRFTILDVGAIISRSKDKMILFVVEENTKVPIDFMDYSVIDRPELPHLHQEELLGQFDKTFYRISEQIKPSLEDEPKRLFEKKEYRAAVISAISLLETELRSYIEYHKNDYRFYSKSINSIIDMAIQMEIINQSMISQLKEWIHIRNKLVHTKESVNGRTAKNIVFGIDKIIRDLKNR